MSNLKFTVSRFFAELTPASRDDGEYSNTGSIYDDQIMSFKELISELRDFTELSQSTIRGAANCDISNWACTDLYIDDYTTGTERQETLHITDCNGAPLTSRQLYKIYKTAGLIK